MVIPDHINMAREVPARTRGKFTGHIERFEYKMLFYDAFHVGTHVRLIGPPLLNLNADLRDASIRTDGKLRNPTLCDVDMTQASVIENVFFKPDVLSIEANGWATESAITKRDNSSFAGRKVLITMSKNNPLEWIADWVNFYVRIHGVDAVLFYDNGSTEYAPEDILKTLKNCDGLKSIIVVEWPFKYGPQGEVRGAGGGAGYCQVSMLSHARYKYLTTARAVVYVDIDELVVSNDGRSLFDHLDRQETGVLLMPGFFIEDADIDRMPRFTDFSEWIPSLDPSPAKWAYLPSRLPKNALLAVHAVNETGLRIRPSKSVAFRHFLGMTTRWNALRIATRHPRIGERAIDHDLLRDLQRAFGTDR